MTEIKLPVRKEKNNRHSRYDTWFIYDHAKQLICRVEQAAHADAIVAALNDRERMREYTCEKCGVVLTKPPHNICKPCWDKTDDGY